VRKRLGVSRASFASADETRALTDMEIGGVTPFGLPELLPLWIDQRVMELDYVLLGGGSRAIKIKIAPTVFRHMPNATIVEGLAKDPA
jgi:prolyl-tRNA editing enzyme YbaK/EbsC (Cys-tRNA(Pro) deacylase)